MTWVLIAANILVYFLWQKGRVVARHAGQPGVSVTISNEWSAIPAELTGHTVPFPGAVRHG